MISIVIPTYNEAKNLPKLFNEIFKVIPDVEVIVVDDNSQDGTTEICSRYPITLLVRTNERGLATACVEGFNNSNGDIIVVMDADLQHPPKKIPELINAINNGADIAIGSRYVEGGSDAKFGLGRRIISKGASSLVNLIFDEVKEIKDKESGFFAFKKKVIKSVKLRPKGYKILLEVLIMGNHNNVQEVGYEFGERYAGESKLGLKTISSYLSHLLSLLWHTGKLTKFIKFGIVGFSGVIANLGILYLLTNTGLYYVISGAISIEASLLTNFTLNRFWTFKEEAKHVNMKKAIVKDHITRTVGAIIQMSCLYVFTEIFAIYYLFSMTIGIIASILWNFAGNIRWVWKHD